MKTVIAMLIAFAANWASAADSGPIVAVTGGQVRGALLAKGGAVFKGIPYAQPPVGDTLYAGNADVLYGSPVQQWATDTSFRCSAVAQLVWHAAAGNPAFEYEFARVPKGSGKGAGHGLDLPYVFGTLDQKIDIPGLPPPVFTDVDARISDIMQQYWTNFAKTGDPNGGQLPFWPRFNASSRAYIQFTDSGPVAREGLRRPFCDLFIENVNRLMEQQVPGK